MSPAPTPTSPTPTSSTRTSLTPANSPTNSPTSSTFAPVIGCDRIRSAQRARWRRSGRLIAAAFSTLLAAAPAARADQILETETISLTSYLAGATNVQDLSPQAMQRGVHLDGSGRVGDFLGAMAPGHAGSDGGFNRHRTLSGQLDLALGAVTIADVDMALPAEPGGGWVVGRTYNARQRVGGSHHVSSGPMGNNWATSVPEIALYHDSQAQDDADDILYLVAGADRYVEFKRDGASSSEFKATNGATGVFQFEEGAGEEPDTYTLFLPDGTKMVFFGFDEVADPAAGQFWKKIDASGNTVFVGDETTGSTAISSGYSSGRVTTVYDETDNDGRRYTYTYSGAGKLTQVEAETKSGGTWASPTGLATVATIDYTYYDSVESFGSEHDLKTVTITTPMSDGTTDLVQKKYYRYWEGTFDDTTNPGHPSALQYIVEFEGYRQADWADTTWDDDPLSMSEGTLKPYAAAYFEYDSSRRVDKAWFNGECGCSGATNGVYEISYGTTGSIAAPYDSNWKLRAVVERPDGTYVTTYFDEVGQVFGHATTDSDPSGSPTETWATTVIRDTNGRISAICTPANVTGYTHSTGAFTTSLTVGLVQFFSRQSTGDLTGFLQHYQHREGLTGTAYLDRTVAYTTRGLVVGGVTLTSPFMNSVKSVHAENETTGTVAAADYDETQTGFTWYSATTTDVLSLRPKTITTTLPVVTTATNGSNTANTMVRYLRQDGTTAFSEAADDIFTYMEYDDGRLVTRIADCDTDDTGVYDLDPNGHFGITETDAGVHVVTTMTYDAQGRPDETTAPDGDVSKMWYTILADRTQVTLSAPLVVAGSPDTFHGPAGYSVSSQAGKPVFSGALAFSGGTTTTDISNWIDEADDMPLEAVATGSATRVSTSVYNESGGTMLESRSYFDLPTGTPDWVGTEGTHYDATTFAYDGMGRRIRTEDPTGTVSRAVYDTLGRVDSTEVGTDDTGDPGGDTGGTNNMIAVSETVYDSGNDGGNSLVTKTIAHLDDSGTNTRETSYIHDYRGRRIVTVPPTAPYTVVKHDNLGRVVAVGQYSSSSGLTAATDPTSTAGNRLALSETAFDALGRAWKTTRHEIDAADGSSDDTLTSQSWFDAAGRLIKVQGDQLAKTAYDRLGRVTTQFILATDNDTGYTDADDVTGDKVVEQTVTLYESTDSNVVLVSATISRPHDNTTHTGSLDSGADADDDTFTQANLTGRIQIAAVWHDALERVTTTGFYGTNGGADFSRGGTAPTQATSDVLVTETVYNDDGTVLETEDAIETVTRTLYDDAGRQTAVIRNYKNGTPSGATGADDLFTRYDYENGQRITMWVDIDGDGTKDTGVDQVTRWIYGVTTGTDAWDSEVNSNRLLRGIVYPDSSNTATTAAGLDPSGSDGDNDDDVVTFAYNAQGEVIWRQDQTSGADGGGTQVLGNVIETTYDGSGRPTARKATNVATGFDDAIERIATAYDSLGRVETVTQYDDPSAGTAKDQVKFSYSGWGLVTKVEQDHDSIVGGSGVTDYEVSYTYAVSDTSGERQTIRRTDMTMPGGQSVAYAYSAVSSLDDALSRVTNVLFGANGTAIAGYEYLGAGMLVGTDLPQPDVFSNLYTGAATYGNLDRFNRVTSSIWTKDLATDRDFYDVDITYDDAGNITEVVDNVLQFTGGASDRRFDSLYALDPMGRLLAMERGHSNGTAIVTGTEQEDRDWLLSQTGNWAERKVDYDADGSYTDPNELNEDNPVTGGSSHFTLANEWIARDIDDDGSDDYTLIYDDAGNMTSDGKDYNYTYDAFGRLVDISGIVIDATVKAYRYNGLGWRITDDDGTTTEHLVYNEKWQLLARFNGADVREQWLPHAAGLVGLDGDGGSSYIDSVILRTTYDDLEAEDGRFYYCQNWRADVSVVLDDAGVQQERVSYSPYGQPFGLAAGDTDFDGDHDDADDSAISGWSTGDGSGGPLPYRGYADVDLNGSVTGADATAADADTLGWEVLTSDDVENRLAQIGSIQDRGVVQFHILRASIYSHLLGRTLQRYGSALDATGSGGVGLATLCPPGSSYGPCGCEIIAIDSRLAGCGSGEPKDPGGGSQPDPGGVLQPAEPCYSCAGGSGEQKEEPVSDCDRCCTEACKRSGPFVWGLVACCGKTATACTCSQKIDRDHAGCFGEQFKECIRRKEQGHVPLADCSGVDGCAIATDYPVKGGKCAFLCSECREHRALFACVLNIDCGRCQDWYECHTKKVHALLRMIDPMNRYCIECELCPSGGTSQE